MTMNLDTLSTLTTTETTTTETPEPMLTCAYCGHEHPESDMTPLGCADEYFCPDCVDEMVVCEDCGEVHHINEAFYVHETDEHDGYYVCEDCLDTNYKRCDECGGYFRSDVMVIHDHCNYCLTCYSENFIECQECGGVIRSDEACWDAEINAHVCESCYNEARRIILPYHSPRRPDIEFLHTAAEFPNPLYFGVELEIDGAGEDDDNARTILEALGAEHAHAEHDGSLDDGFELVSQPFTMRYYTQTLSTRYAEAMTTAADLGYKSHDTNTCGLHIHVGREGLGSTVEEREDTITKLWILMYRFQAQLVTLSRRSTGNLLRWAALPTLGDIGENSYQTLRTQALPDIKLKLKQRGAHNRYKALNLTNSNTIEFRLFRGTLKHSTLTATLQLVHNLCALAMSMSGSDALTVTWEQLQTLLCIDSPELKEYMARRFKTAAM